ncbi:MAG: hypothetical protein ACYTDY_20260 [Planctomycetota bacterium]|jgi:hypothetical protein
MDAIMASIRGPSRKTTFLDHDLPPVEVDGVLVLQAVRDLEHPGRLEAGGRGAAHDRAGGAPPDLLHVGEDLELLEDPGERAVARDARHRSPAEGDGEVVLRILGETLEDAVAAGTAGSEDFVPLGNDALVGVLSVAHEPCRPRSPARRHATRTPAAGHGS